MSGGRRIAATFLLDAALVLLVGPSVLWLLEHPELTEAQALRRYWPCYVFGSGLLVFRMWMVGR